MATTEAEKIETLKKMVEDNGCVFVNRVVEAGKVRAGTNHRRVRTYVTFICGCQKDLPTDQQIITKKEVGRSLVVCHCRRCGNKMREATCMDRYGVTHYTDIINNKD